MVDWKIIVVNHGSVLEASPSYPVQPTKAPSVVASMPNYFFGYFDSIHALYVPSTTMSIMASLSINPSTSMVPCSLISVGLVVLDAKVTSTTSSWKSTSSNGYNLIPWPEQASGGLGFNPRISQGGKGRGRKTFFSKAKDKACQEIFDGCQDSLVMVLRVSNAPGRVLS